MWRSYIKVKCHSGVLLSKSGTKETHKELWFSKRCKYEFIYKHREWHFLWLMPVVISRSHLVDFWPLRLRKLKERKKPPFPPVGVFGPSSPRSCANSVPGRSIRRVMLLSTSSRKTSGFSWRSFSTKKSGLKMTGGRPAREPPGDSSWLITILHAVPLKGRHGEIVNTVFS